MLLVHINSGELMMKKARIYHVFLFLSTFVRGLVEVFSLVLLYKKGFSVAEIFLFLFLIYGIGILVNYISLRISYKRVLIGASMLYGVSFLYLSFMGNDMGSLFLLAVLFSSSNYSYHTIRHLLALTLVDDGEHATRGIIMVMYLGTILSSLVGMYLLDRVSLVVTSIIIFVGSLLAVMPVVKLEDKFPSFKQDNFLKLHIGRDKILFSIFEQFKVIFLEVQPLFLYLYIEQSIFYVGVFHVIVHLASLIVVYFLANRVRKRYFRYVCLLLGIVFGLKLNMKSGVILFGLAFLEGIFVKLYENVSLENLYAVGENSVREYLMVEEFIFFFTKCVVMGVVCLFDISIYIVLYCCIVGMAISGFFIRE